MMHRVKAIWRKAKYEFHSVKSLAKFRLKKDELMERMERALPMLSVEVTNICNANCVFCAYQYQERPTGVMSVELFRKVVDEYAECGGGPLGLTPTVGDPLVDSHLLERIRYAKSKPEITTVGMFSNLISLQRFGAEALVHSGLDHLTVSTSGFDAEMYQRVYRSSQYQRVLSNILEFARVNNAAARPVQFVIDMRIDQSIAKVCRSPDYLEVEELVGAENIAHKYRYDNWAGKIEAEELTGNMKLRQPNALRRPRISPCSELFSGPMVYWDGKVGACGCRDVNASELIIGDANEDHIADIWFGHEIQKLRDEFLTTKVRDICKNCTHYNNLSHLLRPDHKRELEIATKPAQWERTLANG